MHICALHRSTGKQVQCLLIFLAGFSEALRSQLIQGMQQFKITKYRKFGSFIDSKFVHHVSLNYCLFHLVTSAKPKPSPQDADTTKDGKSEVCVLKDSPSQLQGMYQISKPSILMMIMIPIV